MFDIKIVSYDFKTGLHISSCQCNSSQEAEELCVRYIALSRMAPSGCMFSRETTTFIEAYSANDVYYIASYINANYFMPPLDVYVFYGSSQKGLASRWCVGFNYPQEQVNKLINFLNNGQNPVVADKDPQSWQDAYGNSYSVIILTRVMEHELSEECKKRVNLCLSVIANTTARKLNPLHVQ